MHLYNRHPDEGSTVILVKVQPSSKGRWTVIPMKVHPSSLNRGGSGKTREPSQEKSEAFQEALNGGLSKGDIWKWDFAMKLAFDMLILTAPSRANSQEMRHLDRESAA